MEMGSLLRTVLCLLLLGLHPMCRWRTYARSQRQHKQQRHSRLLGSRRGQADFMAVSVNRVGQRELRVAFRHLLLLETTAAPLPTPDPPGTSGSGKPSSASSPSGWDVPVHSPGREVLGDDARMVSARQDSASSSSPSGIEQPSAPSSKDSSSSLSSSAQELSSSSSSSSFPGRKSSSSSSSAMPSSPLSPGASGSGFSPSLPILRQVTDGRRLVSGVFKDGALRDCDISRSPLAILQFLDEFRRGLPALRRASSSHVFDAYHQAALALSSSSSGPPAGNSSSTWVPLAFKPVRDHKGLGDFSKLVIIRHQIRPCRALLRDMRRLSRRAGKSRRPKNGHATGHGGSSKPRSRRRGARKSGVYDDSSSSSQTRRGTRVGSTKHKTDPPDDDFGAKKHSTNETTAHVLGSDDSAADVKVYANTTSLDGGLEGHGRASGAHGRRSRRSLLSGWFIFPGTKWCGDGDVAENEEDLGYDQETDKCCRKHDLCRHVIPRLSWRYELFNFRLHTMSHCKCDRGFRRCLQRVTSPSASMVGKIYFNVIGPQCFKLSKHHACVSRTWWGVCRKYGIVKRATPRYQRGF